MPEPFGTIQNAFFSRDRKNAPCKCESPAAPGTPCFTKPQLSGSVAEKISFKRAVKTDQSLAVTVSHIFLLNIFSPLRSSASTAGSCPAAAAAGYSAVSAIFHESIPASAFGQTCANPLGPNELVHPWLHLEGSRAAQRDLRAQFGCLKQW